MKESVKKYVVSELTKFYQDYYVEDDVNGFCVVFDGIIPNVVLLQLFTLKSFLDDMDVSFYISVRHNDDKDDDFPCIRFY